LPGFASINGRKFYGLETDEEGLTLRRGEGTVEMGYTLDDSKDAGTAVVVPFWAGKKLGWELV